MSVFISLPFRPDSSLELLYYLLVFVSRALTFLLQKKTCLGRVSVGHPPLIVLCPPFLPLQSSSWQYLVVNLLRNPPLKLWDVNRVRSIHLEKRYGF